MEEDGEASVGLIEDKKDKRSIPIRVKDICQEILMWT